MIDIRHIEELAGKLAALVPPGLRDAREDLTATFKSALQAGLGKMNLVTREEFEVQKLVLARTREKIEALEKKLAALEAPPPEAG
ncbi:MAG TPA: accessory factor UbiK family protein [Xanthomonadales bacterium]|nr:accessory factor UbiK family protein [Xanthomonadales bacterium]